MVNRRLDRTVEVALYYDKGTICVKGGNLNHIPKTVFDKRSKVLRAPAIHYREIIDYLRSSEIDYIDQVIDLIPSQIIKTRELNLRDYQQKALKCWINATMRGCVVLPTGAGKTAIGIKAIQQANTATMVVVPTIDLMDQWAQTISRYICVDRDYDDNDNYSYNNESNGIVKVGRLGAGEEDLQPITVATYDSSYLKAPYLGNKFGLIIFDEVHHIPAPGYRMIAEQTIAPYRLGLTATIQREDQLHELIPQLVGGIVFQLGAQQLEEKQHLANYNLECRQVDLFPDEKQQYQINYTKFLSNLKKLGFVVPSMFNLRRVIMMSNRNKTAREAILARNKANDIALNSKAKIIELQKILQQNKGIKTIIFTQHNKMVYQLSSRFLIPFITHKTSKEERADVLKGFKSGKYNAVVTSKVLDEGIDVPDAELGIIVSGTGSGREFIQRLGRLLRPKSDINTKAKLIEIISRQTRETSTSAKRLTALKKASKVAHIENYSHGDQQSFEVT